MGVQPDTLPPNFHIAVWYDAPYWFAGYTFMHNRKKYMNQVTSTDLPGEVLLAELCEHAKQSYERLVGVAP